MEENVALDSKKQKQFIKSIKGIKKILKVNDTSKLKKDKENNVQIGKIKKPKRKTRGLVYLSHIPHGFYEHQMTEYFKQFGVVTNARVIRSKRTGMSKGHAFVEFRDPKVAQIVAETMNNYLMGKRLIKAAIIPPEKQRKFAKRKHWNAQNNPGNDLRQKLKKAHNSVKDENKELQIARKLLSNLNKTKKRLRELDIDYDFFTPVDIPEPLSKLVEVKKEEEINTNLVKKEDVVKNEVKKEKNVQNDTKKNKGKKANDIKDVAQVSTTPVQADSSASKKSKKSKEIQQSNDKSNLVKATKDIITKLKEKELANETKDKKKGKKAETKSKMSETQQQKEKKLKEAGVKPPEDFIQLQKESGDESDSSVNFDSDEYDKAMEQDDSDVQSDDESDEDLDEEVTSEEDASDVESPPPKKVEKPINTKITTRNQQQSKKQRLEINKPQPQLTKRIPQKNTKPSKKPKFEKKGNKKTMNKVIMKKK